MCPPRELDLSQAGIQTLKDAISREIDKGTMPGAVFMMGRYGKVAMLEAFGQQSPMSNVPMKTDSVFRIFSMTKPVISLAIMMLMEQGHILLTDSLSKFIPQFTKMHVLVQNNGKVSLVPAKRQITIADLLMHTSGLAHHANEPGYIQKLYADWDITRRDQTNEEHARTLAKTPLVSHPGDQWNYSRSSDILGRVIEIISGETLGDFLSTRIFTPLQMHDTGFHIDEERGRNRLAEPFSVDPWDGSKITPFNMLEKPKFEAAGSGLVSTAPDYARFLQLMINGGELDGVRLVGTKTVDLMMANHLAPDVKIDSQLMPRGYGFGLGFAVRTHAGLAPFPGSVGDCYWTGSFGTQFCIDPKENMWALFMMQAPGPRFHIRIMIRNLVYAALDV